MARCIYPITIGKKDGMKKWQVVPCGKCVPCKRRRQAAWSFRLLQEQQHSTSAVFLTLTYDDDNLKYGANGIPTLCKEDYQLFMKRLRKLVPKEEYVKKNGEVGKRSNLVYYACGEYGEKTLRPHYHSIMFNLPPNLMWDAPLSDVWKNGHVRVDACNVKSIQYVTKYVMKFNEIPEDLEPEFSLMSKGIGKRYLTDQVKKYYKDNKIPYVVWKDGQKMTMPRYFKEMIFSEEELREFGKKALEEIEPQTLDKTKVFQINEMNRKQKQINHDRRKKV